jgi:hypothetical protein
MYDFIIVGVGSSGAALYGLAGHYNEDRNQSQSEELDQ